MKKTLKASIGRWPFKKTNFLSLICLVESIVIHILNLSYLACLNKKLVIKKTLKSSYKDDLLKKQNFLSKMYLVESYVVHTSNLSFLSSLIKKLDMKKTLKMRFGRRLSPSYQKLEIKNDKWQSYSSLKMVK